MSKYAANKNTKNLTEGPILGSLLLFALPMLVGNILQQVYNVADTMIVGKFISADALAAVGSSTTLMNFLLSLIIGICMGSGALFSARFGAGELEELRKDIWLTICFIAGITVLVYAIVFPGTDTILHLLHVPEEVYSDMRIYVRIVFIGLGFTALYNFFAYLLRSVGNSKVPVYFLVFSSILNILLDLLAVIVWKMGIAGAAGATVIAQAVSGLGLAAYTILFVPEVRIRRSDMHWDRERFSFIVLNDIATGMQQSVMFFGILMIQGLINSFGPVVMAAFAAAAKINAFAYMPAKEFANAYSMFNSQNFGAGKKERVNEGTAKAFLFSLCLCIFVSSLHWIFAAPLMGMFVKAEETAIIAEGIRYMHIEGPFFACIGFLQLWYGYFRAIQRPKFSLYLSIVSLGTRVLLSYSLAPNTPLGAIAIYMSIPIGWTLADLTGLCFFFGTKKRRNRMIEANRMNAADK